MINTALRVALNRNMAAIERSVAVKLRTSGSGDGDYSAVTGGTDSSGDARSLVPLKNRHYLLQGIVLLILLFLTL